MKLNNHKGFTLIELLVVIAIIGILSTLAIVALGNARARSRDAKRVSDIRQIHSALELYFNDNGIYPTAITPGNSLSNGTTTYMAAIPSNPTPVNDGNCPTTGGSGSQYSYSHYSNASYVLTYCVGAQTGDITAGTHRAGPNGVNLW